MREPEGIVVEAPGLSEALTALGALLAIASETILPEREITSETLTRSISIDPSADLSRVDPLSIASDLSNLFAETGDIGPAGSSRLAVALAAADEAVQLKIFDCYLGAPPSPVMYRWRPAPIGLQVLSCNHGPPEHCYKDLYDGTFKQRDCPTASSS